jgi:sugar lactone lactonase YvrE
MLGGADGHTLFVCTARSADPETCKANATGAIETTRVDFARAGLP